MYRYLTVLEWCWGLAAAAVLAALPTNLWAEDPKDTALVVLIAAGIALIGGNLVKLGLDAYKGYRAIDTEGDRGRFLKLQQEMEQLQKDRCVEVDRLTKYHSALCQDYESRLLNKREQIAYLHQQIEIMHGADRQNFEVIADLQKTFARQVELMNEWGHRTATNTAKAIEKIGVAPVISVPPETLASVNPVGKAEVVSPSPGTEPGKMDNGPAEERH